jgi:hypothetical protein
MAEATDESKAPVHYSEGARTSTARGGATNTAQQEGLMPNKNKRPPARRQAPVRTEVIGPSEIALKGEGTLTTHRRIRAVHIIGEDGHQRRWQGDAVDLALQQLYSGHPSRDQLSDTDLVFAVQRHMRDHKMADPLPSKDTILRQAGRRPREKGRKR